MTHRGHGLAVAALAFMVACGPSPNDVKEIKAQQQEILNKLGQFSERLDKVAQVRPARPQPADPNQVYQLPVGNSPAKGPADAKVAIVEFADFQ